MASSDWMFFTSIMEATSTVVLEAITVGLPILCFNTVSYTHLLVTVLLISFFFIGMNILLSPVLNLTWLLVLNMLLWALIHLIINRCIILYKEKSSINEIN